MSLTHQTFLDASQAEIVVVAGPHARKTLSPKFEDEAHLRFDMPHSNASQAEDLPSLSVQFSITQTKDIFRGAKILYNH